MSMTAAIGGLLLTLAGFFSFTRKAEAAALAFTGKIPPQQVRALAAAQIKKYSFNVTPDMAAAIAIIESGDVSFPSNGCNPKATRFEAHIPDTSIGLMQTLLGTAQWLAKDMGYKALGVPTHNALLNGETSLYFGLAYLDYLSKYKNAGRSQDWIVQSYNAGPGRAASAYLKKYKTALTWVQQNGSK